MKKIIIASFLLMSIFNIGCKNNSDDPKAVLMDFFDAMSKKDFEKAKKLSTKESQPMLNLMETASKMDSSGEAKNKYDKSKMEFGEPIIEGDKATISVTEKSKDEKINFSLKKEEGLWKVAFDKASLFNIGMDAIKKEEGFEIDKTVDSLKDKIDESLKKIDSIK